MDNHRTNQAESSAIHDGVRYFTSLLSPANVRKDVFISNNLFYRLVDIGSQLTLLKYSGSTETRHKITDD